MSITHGMDIDGVRRLAEHMDNSAGQIEGLMAQLSQALEGTAWLGPDRDRFQQEWQGTHCTQLRQVVETLRQTAGAARTNAQEQEDVANR